MSTRVQKFIGPGDCNHRFRKPNALISRLRGAGEQAFSACSIGYIHGLICDSITLFHSDACNAKALSNESMILEVLEAEEPAVFRQELFNTLEHYYEEILGLPGAGGRPKPQSFKRKMKSAQPRAAAAAAAGGDSAEDAVDEPPPPPPPADGGGGTEPQAAEEVAAPAGPVAGRRGKGSTRA